MALTQIRCAECGGKNVEGYRTYTIKEGEQRTMYHCASCGCSFSETKHTPLAHLKTPISVIVQVLSALIEGDELYTRVHKNMAPDESQGWTIVLMDRATRFIWDMHCGRKERQLFKKAMGLLCQVIQQTGDLTLLTDGERRYGSLLFELCSEALRTGKRGRPKKTLRKGVKVRLKNKGSQKHKRGPKRLKYQAPYPEHPDTAQPLDTKEIHANHLEAFNTSLRRRCAAYRRRTNMYARTQDDSKKG